MFNQSGHIQSISRSNCGEKAHKSKPPAVVVGLVHKLNTGSTECAGNGTYKLLKGRFAQLSSCLCRQQIDNLIHTNLADIVVELLMTLYEGADGDKGDIKRFIG